MPDSRIIKEGGYQPTKDPGPVPTSLIRQVKRQPVEQLPKPGDEGWSRFVKSIAHPDRVEILRVLSEREATPAELATELNMGLGQISYQVKMLKDSGVVETVRTEPRQGTVEHYYRARLENLSPMLSMVASKGHLGLQDPTTD